MKIAAIILFILFLLISITILVLGLVNVAKSVKSKGEKLAYEILFQKILIYGAAFGVSLMTTLLFTYLMNDITAKWYEYVAAALGGVMFGFCFFVGLCTFITHYYGKNIENKLDKWLFRWMIAGITLSLVFFFVMMDGFADYLNLTRPLCNGINFTKGWAYPDGPLSNIAWYALCILTGAIIVYFYCDHKLYLEYGKHGLLESTFFVALPAGIIGARLFYVIGQWSDFASNPISALYIWEGGLTILGGALTGIVVGVAWFMWRNKGYNIFLVMDIILPSILVAQAIGRWGNFFNCEVHGLEVSGAYFSWLPKIIYNNIQFGGDGNIQAAAGNVFVPLFLIEGCLNFLGFFILAHLFGKRLRRFTEIGDLAAGYFIWYGLIRALLEPLRYKEYIMNDFWSWFWSLAFILVGVLAIIANHTIRDIIRKKKNKMFPNQTWYKRGLISSIIYGSLGLVLIGVSIAMIATSDHLLKVGLEHYQFLSGLVILTIGICLLGLLSISIPRLVRGIKYQKEQHAE